MALIVIFVLGVANFAMHKAVLESGHRLIGQFALTASGQARRFTLAVEFVVLVAAMLGAANGYPGLLWGYLLYSLVNGLSAWLILTGRI